MDGCGQDAPGLPSKTQRATWAAVAAASSLMTIDQKAQTKCHLLPVWHFNRPAERFDEQKRKAEPPPLNQPKEKLYAP